MIVSHLYSMRCAFRDISSLGTLVSKLLVALLRYTDIIPADKAYYEAGIAAQVRTKSFRHFQPKCFMVLLILEILTRYSENLKLNNNWKTIKYLLFYIYITILFPWSIVTIISKISILSEKKCIFCSLKFDWILIWIKIILFWLLHYIYFF